MRSMKQADVCGSRLQKKMLTPTRRPIGWNGIMGHELPNATDCHAYLRRSQSHDECVRVREMRQVTCNRAQKNEVLSSVVLETNMSRPDQFQKRNGARHHYGRGQTLGAKWKNRDGATVARHKKHSQTCLTLNLSSFHSLRTAI